MYGYVIPNTLQNNISSLQKYRNKAKIIFALETSDNPLVFDPNIPVLDDSAGRPNAQNARSLAADRYNVKQAELFKSPSNPESETLLNEISELRLQLIKANEIIQSLQNP